MTTRGNDPAFKVNDSKVITGRLGLTKREEFAKVAMGALLSNSATINETDLSPEFVGGSLASVGLAAVMAADELIAALNNEPNVTDHIFRPQRMTDDEWAAMKRQILEAHARDS